MLEGVQYPVRSPCVGLCSTTYGDLVCRGCRRTSEEITIWHGLEEDAKKRILQRLDKHLETVFAPIVVIEDAQLLLSRVSQFQLNYDLNRSQWSWLFILLVKKSNDIEDCQNFGFRILVDERLPKLIRKCLLKLYQLACEG